MDPAELPDAKPKVAPVEYPDDGHIFVCVRVRNAAVLPCMNGGEGNGGTNTPRMNKQERRVMSKISVSSVENVVVVHEPKSVDDVSSVARDTNNVVQLLTERAHARSNKAAHKANLLASKLLTPTPTANFYECDACINSMDDSAMLAMPIIKHSDFIRPPSYGNQEDVYLTTAAHAVRAAVNGINSCVFAYGQTGSGKTYTLFGDTTCLSRDPGVVPRTLDDLFDQLNAIKESHLNDTVTEYSYRAQLSLFEIYNNDVYCLFSRQGPLRVSFNRDPSTTRETMVIHNLQTQGIASASKAFPLIESGLRYRQTSETGMNARSSRSHAILQIAVTQWRTNRHTRETVQLNSTINLVDLAGSERQKTARTDGKTREEGIQINQSLATLARVINDISRGAKYINYRDSLLTMVLKDNLGGNSKTFMIATVSPLAFCQQESCATLTYARDVRKIRNRPVVNKTFQTRANLLEMNARLKIENDQLKLHIEQLVEDRNNRVEDSDNAEDSVAAINGVEHTPGSAGKRYADGRSPQRQAQRILGELMWEPTKDSVSQSEAVLAQQRGDGVLDPLVISAQRTYQCCTGVGGSCVEGDVRVTTLQHEAMNIRINRAITGLEDKDADLGAIEFECVSQRKCDKHYWLRYIPSATESKMYSVDVRVNGMRFMTDRHEMVHGDVIAVFVDRIDDESAPQRLMTFHYVDLMSLSRHSVLGKRQGLDPLQYGALRVSVDLPDGERDFAESENGDDVQSRIRQLERENAKLMEMLRSQANTIEYQQQKARGASQSRFVSRAPSLRSDSGRNSPTAHFEDGYNTPTADPYNIPTQRTNMSPSLARDAGAAMYNSPEEVIMPSHIAQRHAMAEDLQRQIELLRMNCENHSKTSSSEATSGDAKSNCTHATIRERSFYVVDRLQGPLSEGDDGFENSRKGVGIGNDDALSCTTNNMASMEHPGTRDCSSPSINASQGGRSATTISETYSGALDSGYAARMRDVHDSAQNSDGANSTHTHPLRRDTAVGGEENQLGAFTLPSADEILRRHRAAPDRFYLPTSEGVCERFLSAKRERVLCERIWELEELLAQMRGETALLESRCRIGQDSVLDAEVRIAQLEDELAELEKSLEDALSENRAIATDVSTLEELLHRTEDALAAARALSDDELNERLASILDSHAALHALARMWKRRALERMVRNRQSGRRSLDGDEDPALPWKSISAEANATAARKLLRESGCSAVASSTIDSFERGSAQDTVLALETVLNDLQKNNRSLQSEVKRYRDELSAYIDLVDRLRRELSDMESRSAARAQTGKPADQDAIAREKEAYARKCRELADAEARLAEITSKLNEAADDCEEAQRNSVQNNELLLHEQRRIIDMQSGEQARLSAKLMAKDEELRTALTFLEEQAAMVDSGSQKDIAMRERVERLIEEAMGNLGQSGPGLYSAFPTEFQFSNELVTLIRICLRVLMDRLKVELYVLNRQSVHKFGLLVPAISLRPETQFNSFMHELRGVIAEMTGKTQRIGSRWALGEGDVLEKLVDHRRRRAGDALSGLLVWYDHWDLSPKSEHISYVELIRNTERVLQVARLVRQESRVNTNASSTQSFPVPTSNSKIDVMYVDEDAFLKDNSVLRSKKILVRQSTDTMRSNLARCVAMVRTPSKTALPSQLENNNATPASRTMSENPGLFTPLQRTPSQIFGTPNYETATATPPSTQRYINTPSAGGRSAFKETLSSTIITTTEGTNLASARATVMPMTDADLTIVGAGMMVRTDSLTTYNQGRRASNAGNASRATPRGDTAFRRNHTATAIVPAKDIPTGASINFAGEGFARYPTATTLSVETLKQSAVSLTKKPCSRRTSATEPVSVSFLRLATESSLGKNEQIASTEPKTQGLKRTNSRKVTPATKPTAGGRKKGVPGAHRGRGRQQNESTTEAVNAHNPEAAPYHTEASRPSSMCLSPLSSRVSSSTASMCSSRVRGTIGSYSSSPSVQPLAISTTTSCSYYDPAVMNSLNIRGNEPKTSKKAAARLASSNTLARTASRGTGTTTPTAVLARKVSRTVTSPTIAKRTPRVVSPTTIVRGGDKVAVKPEAKKLTPLRRTTTPTTGGFPRRFSPLRRTSSSSASHLAAHERPATNSPLKRIATTTSLATANVRRGENLNDAQRSPKKNLVRTVSGVTRMATPKSTRVGGTSPENLPKLDMMVVRVHGLK